MSPQGHGEKKKKKMSWVAKYTPSGFKFKFKFLNVFSSMALYDAIKGGSPGRIPCKGLNSSWLII